MIFDSKKSTSIYIKDADREVENGVVEVVVARSKMVMAASSMCNGGNNGLTDKKKSSKCTEAQYISGYITDQAV